MSDTAISIQGLSKTYRSRRSKEPEVHALRELELSVQRGEVFGLLGPNGAGKTTLVKMLLGVVFPSSGKASIFDAPIGSVDSRRRAGYLPENHRYPGYLTGDGVLRYFGRLSGLERSALAARIDKLLDVVNMTKWRTTRVKNYSKGMLQRIGLAQALINEPDVVFLDEPTDGVDPIGRKEIRDVILQLRDNGTTIFLNSHLLSEVELISDRVAILDKGSMLRLDTVGNLTRGGSRTRVEFDGPLTDKRRSAIVSIPGVEIGLHSVTVDLALRELNDLLDALRSDGLLIRSVQPLRATLEEIFMKVVGGREGME